RGSPCDRRGPVRAGGAGRAGSREGPEEAGGRDREDAADRSAEEDVLPVADRVLPVKEVAHRGGRDAARRSREEETAHEREARQPFRKKRYDRGGRGHGDDRRDDGLPVVNEE